jgi:hypothetical protein
VKQAVSVKAVKAWIGLSNGKPFLYSSEYYQGIRHGDFFASKKAARVCYQHVIPVLITPIIKKERKP